MSGPCRASKRLGCPDTPAVLVCHRPAHEAAWDHYDAQEQVWWMDAGRWPEPELFGATQKTAASPGPVKGQD